LETNNENSESVKPPIPPEKKSTKPTYRALHAYRYRTKIPQTEVQFFEESLDQYRIKTETNTNDRAKNKLFKIPWLGKLQISEPTGAITIYTDKPQAIDRLEKHIGKPLYKEIQTNLLTNSYGAHIPTTQIKLGQTIKTDQNTPLGKATITTTLGIHRGYIDLHQHFKIPSPYSDKFIEKKASKCRVSDAVILKFAIFNGQVTPNDYACFGLRSKSLYPRLVRMEKKGLLCRLGGKGIIYIVTGVANSIINRSSQSVR
jgi:hypothetical protein